MMRKVLSATLALTLLALAVRPASALIAIQLTMSKVFQADSQQVIVGKIDRLNAPNQMALASAEVVKGSANVDKLRLSIQSPDLFAKLSAGQPVVLLVSKGKGNTAALAHVGDAWWKANTEAGSGVWVIGGELPIKTTFPGRTVAMVELVKAMKAEKPGKPAILDAMPAKVFGGGAHEVAKLSVTGATFLAAADVNGDQKPDLLVGTADGVKLFLNTGKGFEDATEAWGLKGAKGTHAAFGDIHGDGKPGLLLDGTLYVNAGGKFAVVPGLAPVLGRNDPKPEATITAVGLADADGDGKPDALFLLSNGQIVGYANPGADGPWKLLPPSELASPKSNVEPASCGVFGNFGDTSKAHALLVRPGGVTRYALSADGGPPADYDALTGEKWSTHANLASGMKPLAAVPLDFNGDGRPGVLVVTPAGSLLLVNRGFGAFLSNADALASLTRPPAGAVGVDLKPTTRFAAADLRGTGRQDLLILTDDGRLLAVDNTDAGKP